jgi:Tfp pilus assembly protein PilF
MPMDPSKRPNAKRGQDLRNGVLLGAAAAVVFGGAIFAGFSAPGSSTATPEPTGPVYRDGAPATVDDLPEPRRMVVLPGRIHTDDPRGAEFEALLRLHLALGLRDVHSGPVALSWAPARGGSLEDRLCAGPGPLDPASGPWLLSGDRPDPLGRVARLEDDLRVSIDVRLGPEGLQLTAQGCSARSDRFSQVVEGRPDRLDVHLGELLTWLSSRLGVSDARPFEETWKRLPAFGGPAGRAYGRALVASLGGEAGADLGGAAQLGAEAAWLSAWLGPRSERLGTLLRATELRWSFTAAVEDAAWEHVDGGRPDLARAVLERLAPADERARPVELALASWLLDQGDHRACHRLLEQLPARWNRTTAAARLRSRLALGLGDAERAEGWIDAWLEADPEAAEAWLMRGDILSGKGERRAAEKAWLTAAELDDEQGRRALAREAAAAVDRGDPEVFAARLDERDDTLGPPPPWMIELDAWVALAAGDVDRAAQGYSSLAGPNAPERVRLNACIAAIRAGRGAEEAACGEAAGSPWQRSRIELALKSLEPGLLPGYPPILDRDVEDQLELAPRHPAAVHAAWLVLGPFAEPAERRALAARWRVAHGAGVDLPELAWIKDEEKTPTP